MNLGESGIVSLLNYIKFTLEFRPDLLKGVVLLCTVKTVIYLKGN